MSAQHLPTTWAQSPPPQAVNVRVDPSTALRPISPLIYGLAHAKAEEVASTGATINRWGGNPNTRYNWQVGNAWNSARDWEFRNYGDDGTQGTGPSSVADRFVSDNVHQSLASILTVPSIGWVRALATGSSHRLECRPTGGPRLRAEPWVLSEDTTRASTVRGPAFHHCRERRPQATKASCIRTSGSAPCPALWNRRGRRRSLLCDRQ